MPSRPPLGTAFDSHSHHSFTSLLDQSDFVEPVCIDTFCAADNFTSGCWGLDRVVWTAGIGLV